MARHAWSSWIGRQRPHVLRLCLLLMLPACGRTASRNPQRDVAADSARLLEVLEARADSLHRWLRGDLSVVAEPIERGVDPDVAILGLTRRLRDAESEWRAVVPPIDSVPTPSPFGALADSVVAFQGRRIEPRLRRALAVVPEVVELCDRSPASWYCRVENVYRGRHLTPRMAMALDTLQTLAQTAEQWATEEEEQHWEDIGWLAGYYKRYLTRRRLVTREWVEWDESRQLGTISPAGRARERIAETIENTLRSQGCRGCWAVVTDSDYTTLRVLDTRAEDTPNDYRDAPVDLWEAGFLEVEYLSSPGRIYAVHRRSPDD